MHATNKPFLTLISRVNPHEKLHTPHRCTDLYLAVCTISRYFSIDLCRSLWLSRLVTVCSCLLALSVFLARPVAVRLLCREAVRSLESQCGTPVLTHACRMLMCEVCTCFSVEDLRAQISAESASKIDLGRLSGVGVFLVHPLLSLPFRPPHSLRRFQMAAPLLNKKLGKRQNRRNTQTITKFNFHAKERGATHPPLRAPRHTRVCTCTYRREIAERNAQAQPPLEDMHMLGNQTNRRADLLHLLRKRDFLAERGCAYLCSMLKCTYT